MKTLIFLFLLVSTVHAAAIDIRLSDNDGDVVDISEDGELQTSSTNTVSADSATKAPDKRISDDDGDVLDINSDGSINLD